MKLGELGVEFLKQNKQTMIAYIIVVLVLFPTESIVLSKLYGKLFSRIGEVGKNSKSMMNFIKKDLFSMKSANSLQALIVGIIGLWLFVILAKSMKMKIETKIYPRIIVFLRSQLFKKPLNVTKIIMKNYLLENISLVWMKLAIV